MIKYIYHRIRKDNRGVALVEAAFVVPFLLILVMGLVEFGWIFNGYITLTGAAREGARVAAIDGDYEKAVDEHTKSVNGLNVNSTSKSGGEVQGDEIKVTVTGNIPLLVGFLNFLDNPFPLSAEATMRRQYLD